MVETLRVLSAADIMHSVSRSTRLAASRCVGVIGMVILRGCPDGAIVGSLTTDPGTPMGTTAVIGLGILAWILMAIPLALFVGRMIRIRDRQRPDRTEPGAPAEGTSRDGTGDGTGACHTPRRWSLRNKA
jgi:hypothetical protein